MPLASLRRGTAPSLPLRRLPAFHLPQTLWLPTIPLVPLPRLKTPAASLAEADPRPQPSSPGRNIPVRRRMLWSHGRCLLSWGSPGRNAILLGHLPTVFDSTSSRRAATACRRTLGKRRRTSEAPKETSAKEAGSQVEAKKTSNQTVQRCALPKADREGDGPLEGDRGRRGRKKTPCASR